jgi:flagellar basal-body rod protein FlgF
MDAAMYKALSGAVVQMHRLEVTAQDLANVNTSGYKGQRLSFGEVLAKRLPGEDRPGGLVAVASQLTDLGQGEIQPTGNPLNLALQGDGLFAVQTSRGVRYTRNGAFTLKPDGTLSTMQGDAVLGEGGPIQITGVKIQVAGDGTITSDDGEIGKLKLVRFADPQRVAKEGTNLFVTAPENLQEAADPRVLQGNLEQSNVSSIEGMVSLIALNRQFEASQRAMTLMDSVTQKMISYGAS